MANQLTAIAERYVQSVNHHDAASFLSLFDNETTVMDNGREFRGIEAIKKWSDREIFDADVTLEVIDVDVRDGETVVTTKVDGNFDRTGLPDPVIIEHYISSRDGKILQLTCRLAVEASKS
jgi:hypothetical protein